jgi:hypothetical protein
VKQLERDIQANVTKESTSLGLIPIRINVSGRKGWPDYGYMYMGRIAFIEFKRPGERPDPLQAHVHKLLNAAQIPVFVVNNEDYGNTLLKEWKHAVDGERKALDELRSKSGQNRRN